MNEDVANQRLAELEHELDATGLWAVSGPNLIDLARRLGGRIWFLAGGAVRRPARPASPAGLLRSSGCDEEASSAEGAA